MNFDAAIAGLDVGLFASVESLSTPHDKRTLLACQLGLRNAAAEYVYLEIGSHMGGSLQPYLADPRCTKIYSIDTRIAQQPDARGQTFKYPGNTRARMLDGLARVPGADLAKITCFDTGVGSIDPSEVRPRPNLCFIDGEHTDPAVLNDFAFCRSVVAPDGAVLFHDAAIVYLGLEQIIADLTRAGVTFRAYNLPDTVFVIEFGACQLHRTPAIQDMLLNNHVGYLAALRYNDHYRRFANRRVFRALRAIKSRLVAGFGS